MDKERLKSLLMELRDIYQDKLEDASSMWKSEYCCSQGESDIRDMEDREDLLYFSELLGEIYNNYIEDKERGV